MLSSPTTIGSVADQPPGAIDTVIKVMIVAVAHRDQHPDYWFGR
jgi:hypothetical protein